MLLGTRVGARQQQTPVGVVTAAGPDLLTVDNEGIAVDLCAALQEGRAPARMPDEFTPITSNTEDVA